MKFTELLAIRNRYHKKSLEIAEQLKKGNPMFVGKRKMPVFEMVHAQSSLKRIVDMIDNLEIDVDEEIVDSITGR